MKWFKVDCWVFLFALAISFLRARFEALKWCCTGRLIAESRNVEDGTDENEECADCSEIRAKTLSSEDNAALTVSLMARSLR